MAIDSLKQPTPQKIIFNQKSSDEDLSNFDNTIRPQNLNEYIGQSKIKDHLHIMINSAKTRQTSLEHLLFYGPPGLGKTTIANILAKEMTVNIRTISGPALEKVSDLISILTNLEANDILFIDEIHRLKTNLEEVLYSAMEDFALDIIIGKGPSARTMKINLPHFTIVGATTKISMLSNPLRDRFWQIFKLDYYSEIEIQAIIKRSSTILGIVINDDATQILGHRCRYTPRIANRLLRRLRDFALMSDQNKIDLKLTTKCLQALDIDTKGLDKADKELLTIIYEKFSGGPVGLSTLAAAMGDDKKTIEDVYEPFLIQLWLLQRTPKGRIITQSGISHLNDLFAK